MILNSGIQIAVDELFREITALEATVASLEDAIQFDNTVSEQDIELLIKEIEFILPILNHSAAVIKEHAKQYLAKKRRSV